MFERIRKRLQPAKPTSTSEIGSYGFVFVADTEVSALQRSGVGATVRNANAGPPWIVVNHSLAAVVVSRWPGRLLRVAITEKANEQPLPGADYMRAVAVVVIEDLPAHSLFGEYGELLAEILGRISTLTLDEALDLSAALQPSSPEIYSTAWKEWLVKEDQNANYLDENHEDTLQYRVRNHVSPVGYALSLVSSMVMNQGLKVSGSTAVAVNADGDAELQAPWTGVSSALLHATMAYGAPGLLTLQQAAVLISPWETVIKAPTGPSGYQRQVGFRSFDPE